MGLIFPSRLALLDNKILADGQIEQHKPGMNVTAEIKIGKCRVATPILQISLLAYKFLPFLIHWHTAENLR